MFSDLWSYIHYAITHDTHLAEDFEMLCLTPDFETLRLTCDFKTIRQVPARRLPDTTFLNQASGGRFCNVASDA